MKAFKPRVAGSPDEAGIRDVHMCAFGEDERAVVAGLAVSLLAESFPPVLSLVVEDHGGLLGHVAFSRAHCAAEAGWQGAILAPLGVRPAWQKQGVGRALIEDGVRRLRAAGVHTLLVYGDPAYYGRFGFSADKAGRYLPPYPLQHPFGWQAIELADAAPAAATLQIACVPALNKPELW
jgi:putative acetyltransferase